MKPFVLAIAVAVLGCSLLAHAQRPTRGQPAASEDSPPAITEATDEYSTEQGIAEPTLSRRPPPSGEGAELTCVQAIAAACRDSRVQRFVGRCESLNVEAEYTDRWHVWIVRFFARSQLVASASVDRSGKVLGVVRATEQPQDKHKDDDQDMGRERQRLERELREARRQGNEAEVREILELLERLQHRSGTGRRQPHAAHGEEPRHTPRSVRSTGQFRGHTWYIDHHHLMHWDGKPYVPFGGFGITPGNRFGLDTYNLWIDFDPFIEKANYTRQQHRRDIAKRLADIERSGGTCIVQFSMALPHLPDGPRPAMRWRQPEGGIDGSRLADPKVREAIFKVWAEYAPAVRNRCVRAIVLWNEINTWRWPPKMTVDQYVEVLSQYVREAKRLVGDVPVCFKTAGTWNAEVAIAAAAAADGLGFDVWFRDPADAEARRQIRRALRMLQRRQKRTTWFFIAEGGRAIAEGGTDEAADVRSYWDRWPPFRSKEEARGMLRAYALAGAKGFIYNGPSSKPESTYHDSYRWLGQIKPHIVALMTSTRPTGR